MRFLVDTNILIYAAGKDFAEHRQARAFLEQHLDSGTPWCLSWHILYEFLRVTTHSRVLPRPLQTEEALRFIFALLSAEGVSVLGATARHADVLRETVTELGRPAGNLFHDVHTAALMREHGVPEIVTADTDFLQFSFLKVTNPVRA